LVLEEGDLTVTTGSHRTPPPLPLEEWEAKKDTLHLAYTAGAEAAGWPREELVSSWSP
jgi:hypothetical protein